MTAAVDNWLDHAHAIGNQTMLREVQRLAAGEPADFLRVKGVAVLANTPGAGAITMDLAPVLVALLGREVIRAAFLSRIETLPEGLHSDARDARLAEIDAELDRLEAQEERLIEASERGGAPITRRSNARPEIVLAP